MFFTAYDILPMPPTKRARETVNGKKWEEDFVGPKVGFHEVHAPPKEILHGEHDEVYHWLKLRLQAINNCLDDDAVLLIFCNYQQLGDLDEIMGELDPPRVIPGNRIMYWQDNRGGNAPRGISYHKHQTVYPIHISTRKRTGFSE